MARQALNSVQVHTDCGQAIEFDSMMGVTVSIACCLLRVDCGLYVF